MDVLFPSTDREILLQRAACVCSLLRGDVPYNRSFGINAKLDAAVPREAQILLGDAAMQVETHVPNANVTRGKVTVSPEGRALVNLAVTEASNG